MPRASADKPAAYSLKLEDFTPDEAITILAKRIGYKSARPPFAKRP
jgi:hypothetical protein